MKTCIACDESKNLCDFKKNIKCKDGRTNKCKLCANRQMKEWRKINPTHSKGNKNEVNKAWAERNKEQVSKRNKEYRTKNRYKINAWASARRARLLMATPDWLSDTHVKEIELFYQIASWYDEPMHVDHIVPLQGKNVCGLHVPWNLQILPAEENRRKHNSWPV